MSVLQAEVINSLDGVSDEILKKILELVKETSKVNVKNKFEKPLNIGNRRVGIANGLYKIPDDIDAYNEEIASYFGV